MEHKPPQGPPHPGSHYSHHESYVTPSVGGITCFNIILVTLTFFFFEVPHPSIPPLAIHHNRDFTESSATEPVVATTSSTSRFVFSIVLFCLFNSISSEKWQAAPLSLQSRATTAIIRPLWNDTYGAWGRVFSDSLLTYAHLLVTIAKFSKEEGYQPNVKDNVDKKTYGSQASKMGFQMGSYVMAINKLIEKGVCNVAN
jgi:hypothetical protein